MRNLMTTRPTTTSRSPGESSLRGQAARRQARAFTILELMIVLAILLAILGIALYNVLGSDEKAKKKITLVQIKAMEGALEYFKADMKRLPTEDEGLAALWSRDAIADEEERSKWAGPYLKEPRPKDQWDHAWIYRAPSEIEGFAFDIVSIGPDGQDGTDDDISNHDDKKNADGEVDEAYKEFQPTDSGSGSGGGTGG